MLDYSLCLVKLVLLRKSNPPLAILKKFLEILATGMHHGIADIGEHGQGLGQTTRQCSVQWFLA